MANRLGLIEAKCPIRFVATTQVPGTTRNVPGYFRATGSSITLNTATRLSLGAASLRLDSDASAQGPHLDQGTIDLVLQRVSVPPKGCKYSLILGIIAKKLNNRFVDNYLTDRDDDEYESLNDFLQEVSRGGPLLHEVITAMLILTHGITSISEDDFRLFSQTLICDCIFILCATLTEENPRGCFWWGHLDCRDQVPCVIEKYFSWMPAFDYRLVPLLTDAETDVIRMLEEHQVATLHRREDGANSNVNRNRADFLSVCMRNQL
jgi:hypothetical protein